MASGPEALGPPNGRRTPLLLAASIVAVAAFGTGRDATAGALDRLKAMYARPHTIPFPADDPYSPAKAELGERLFLDNQISSSGALSCGGCHVAALGFEDGQPRGIGAHGQPLSRHTPTLWNLAWGSTFFWDGRAPTLERQALLPIESSHEMNQSMRLVVAHLAADPAYREAFAEAYPGDVGITSDKVLAAIATYERTLVPQASAFDRWIDGEPDAIPAAAQNGFLLFNGKARCATCHSGFNFTDGAFHDIGLKDAADLGRGAVIGVSEANHAFKTPTLVDIADRAPYMHDGSLPDLAAVLDHYAGDFVARPTLSPDLKPISLSESERADLIAFLQSLDAERPIDAAEVATRAGPPEAPRTATAPVDTDEVEQKNLAFAPGKIVVRAGETVTIANRDSRTHTADVNDPKLHFTSGANPPGGKVSITFPQAGDYTVICSIHPAMRLHVEAR